MCGLKRRDIYTVTFANSVVAGASTSLLRGEEERISPLGAGRSAPRGRGREGEVSGGVGGVERDLAR